MDVFYATYHNYSLPGPDENDNIFKVMGSKVKVKDIFRQRHIDRRFASKYI